MTVKLKSILRQTPWSLVLKTAIAGLIWLLLPEWIFLLYVLWLYFIPPFRSITFLLFFLLYLTSTILLPATLISALVLAALLFLILGIKDLLLIDRISAMTVLTFSLTLLVALEFFYSFGNNALQESWLGVILLGLITFGLLLVFFRSLGSVGQLGKALPQIGPQLISGLLALIFTQLAWALLFLPLNFLDQTALWFLTAVIATELGADYLKLRLNRQTIFTNFAIFLVFGVIILATNQWSL